jgi:hypothetical protein
VTGGENVSGSARAVICSALFVKVIRVSRPGFHDLEDTRATSRPTERTFECTGRQADGARERPIRPDSIDISRLQR